VSAMASKYRNDEVATIMGDLLIRTADGNPRRNPLVKIASDTVENMLRFANEFGLTAAARARLSSRGYGQSPPR
jgi:P27 family predicted phage terminase small subunit